MTLWQINLFVGAVDLILLFLGVQKANYLMKLRYPELHFRKTHWTTKLSNVIKSVMVSICPGLNLVMLYILITRDDKIVEETIEDARRKFLADQQKENENV